LHVLKAMKIGIACGGTGGHIFPGLATAETLRRRGHAVVVWLAGKRVEQTAVRGWDGPVVTVPFGGFGQLRSWRAPLIGLQLWRAIRQCKASLQAHRPEVLLAMGSYASLAPVWAAKSLRIPVVLHESNATPGRAIRFLSRWAAAVAVGFEETRPHLPHHRLVVTGTPLAERGKGEGGGWRVEGESGRVEGGGWKGKAANEQLAHRSQPLAEERKLSVSSEQLAVGSIQYPVSSIQHPASSIQYPVSSIQHPQSAILQNLSPDKFTVLVMGGSGGAHSLNEKAAQAIILLHQAGKPLQVIHLTGLADEQAVRQRYAQAGVPHLVFGFCHDMPEVYRRASLAICRSGAATCTELCRYGVAALLVPYPFATHQHQLANARALIATGAAELRVEAELTPEWLADYIAGAMADPARLDRIRQAALQRRGRDAAEALADLVEEVGKGVEGRRSQGHR
jgi:undecaprenyldiphospho-muramoylpentapeptide beta-N-acetylglucosaminyltransferase